jgi:hypothetical protein
MSTDMTTFTGNIVNFGMARIYPYVATYYSTLATAEVIYNVPEAPIVNEPDTNDSTTVSPLFISAFLISGLVLLTSYKKQRK